MVCVAAVSGLLPECLNQCNISFVHGRIRTRLTSVIAMPAAPIRRPIPTPGNDRANDLAAGLAGEPVERSVLFFGALHTQVVG